MPHVGLAALTGAVLTASSLVGARASAERDERLWMSCEAELVHSDQHGRVADVRFDLPPAMS